MSVTGKTEVAELVLEKGTIFGDYASPKQSVYDTNAAQQYLLGAKLLYDDGRVYRYAKAGAVALVKALMTHAPLPDADLNNEDQTANFPIIGDIVITVEIGTGLALLGEVNGLAGSTLVINDGLGEGDSYQILGSHIGTTDTNMSFVIDSPIRTTWDTTTQIAIVQNSWAGTLVMTEPAVSMAVGVPNVAVAIDNFYWSQVGGPCGIVADTGETMIIGDLVGAPATQTVDGTVGLWVTLTTPWGTAMTAETATGEVSPIWLNLPSS